MRKKTEVALENRFLAELEKNKVPFTSHIFNVGSGLYLPDFVFGRFIVETEDSLTPNRIKRLKSFRKDRPTYTIVLLTDNLKNDERFNAYEGCFNYICEWANVKELLEDIALHQEEEKGK